jgi:putative ABC transport system permease protein
MTRAREFSRVVWIASWLDSLWQDTYYAVRHLRQHPGFTIAACAALVLGLGLNTSLFTLFNALATRPWAVADADRVVTAHYVSSDGGGTSGFGIAEYAFLRTNSQAFSGLIAWRGGAARLGTTGEGRPTAFAFVSHNFFDVLGVRMARGRAFLADEDRAGSARAVVVLGHGLWTRHFGGDASIVGRSLLLDDVPFTVVGIAPPGFDGTEPPNLQSLWIPLASLALLTNDRAQATSLLTNPKHCCSRVAGRLAAGATRDGAQAELAGLSQQYRRQWGWEDGERSRLALGGTAFLSQPGVKVQLVAAAALVSTAVLLVLMLACANVGNLLLARGLARQREFAIRLSIGASRVRVVRQLLTEGFILALFSGGIAVTVAFALPALFVRMVVNEEVQRGIAPDVRVLLFTLGIAVTACLLFALAPALKISQAAVETLAARREVSRRGRRLRSLLLSAQLAVSVALLGSSSLLLRGVQRAQTQDPGFQVEGVFVLSPAFPGQAYDDSRARAFTLQLQTVLNGDGHIGRAALANTPPLAPTRNLANIRLTGTREPRSHLVQVEAVSPEYFSILRLPLVAGRQLQTSDRAGGAITINETMARRYWPGASPVGHAIVVAERLREIVGVVGDAHTTALDVVDPVYYEVTDGGRATRLLLRTSLDDPRPRVQATASALDPRVSIDVRLLSDLLNQSLQTSRALAAIAGVLGLLALVLAVVGVFGVFSYIVQERTRDIGIRMAIGARAPQVIRTVFGYTAWATLGGLAAGFLISFVISQLFARQFYGVSRLDPVANAGVATILLVAAALATGLPVWRATRIQPVTALRAD